jgi:hypothetical protein
MFKKIWFEGNLWQGWITGRDMWQKVVDQYSMPGGVSEEELLEKWRLDVNYDDPTFTVEGTGVSIGFYLGFNNITWNGYRAETYDNLCNLETFLINGVDAEEGDFVENHSDRAPERIDNGAGCGNREADALKAPYDESVLKKYRINLATFQAIAEHVAELISYNRCEHCG